MSLAWLIYILHFLELKYTLFLHIFRINFFPIKECNSVAVDALAVVAAAAAAATKML